MGLLNKLDGCVRACLGFLVARILIALIATAMTVAIATIAFPQTSGTATESEPAAGGNASPVQGTSGTEDDTSVETDPPARLAIPAEVEVEIQRRFNDLRRELLDDRTKLVDWWLTATSIFLTLLGIVAVIAGYLSFKRFREIETEARKSVEAAKQHETAAKDIRERIEGLLSESEERVQHIRGMTAEAADKNPAKANQAAANVRENPTASLIDKAIAQAVSLQQKGTRNEAIKKWRGIASIAEGADNNLAAHAWFSVGYLLQDKDPKGSISAYDEAIRLKPDYAEVYNNRGNAKGALGRHDAAIADFDQAIRLKPDLAEAYSNRGTAKGVRGEHEAAIADCDEAIRLKPDDAAAYSNRGNAKRARGEYEGAIADYDEAIRLKPDLAEAYSNRGDAKDALGRYDAAIDDYDEAIRLKPDLAEAYSNRGTAKGVRGEHEAAIADFDEAIRLKPDLAITYSNRGVAKDALGRYEAAIADYDEAIRLKPDYAEAYSNRGNTKRERGEHEAAIADCDEAILLKPDYAEAYGNRGEAKAALGLKYEARKDFETALELARNANNAKMVAQLEQLLRDLNDAGDS